MEVKRGIANLAIGSETSWYHVGQQRLRDSLEKFDPTSHLFFEQRSSPRKNPALNTEPSPYVDKVIHIGNTAARCHLFLWLDCSIVALQPLEPIWKTIEEQGYFFYESGANCAETCNDRCLEHYGVTRDEAQSMPEIASNIVGINMNDPVGLEFFNLWIHGLRNNAMTGSKWPSDEERLRESIDPRFKYHRQDQSTASLSLGIISRKTGVIIHREGHFVVRAENQHIHQNDSIIFKLKGGE